MIRVCLVDDQTLVRQGVASLLDADAGHRSGRRGRRRRQAVELIAESPRRGADGHAHAHAARHRGAAGAGRRRISCRRRIILTTFDDDQLVLAGIKAGARGYLLKDVSLEQLVAAIRTVADGGSLMQPAVTAAPAVGAGAPATTPSAARAARPADRPRDRDPAPDGRRFLQQEIADSLAWPRAR